MLRYSETTAANADVASVEGEFIARKIAEMESPPSIRILATCDAALVREAAQRFHPAAHVEPLRPDSIRRLESAACLVVSCRDDARIARATGFDGAIVILAEPSDPEEAAAAHAQGASFASPDGGADALVAEFRNAVVIGNNGAPVAPDGQLARMRRLVAAGELVVTLRHSINNPLAALMAEVQLLQLEARDPETRASAGRMLDLVRRVTEITRSLESVRDR